MVSVDEFLRINKFGDFDKFKQRFRIEKRQVRGDLLRGKIFCGYCKTSNAMVPAVTPKMNKKGLTYYFNYRCDEEKHPHKKPRALRAHIVVNYAIDYLKSHSFSSREAYTHYVEEMKRVIAEQETAIDSQIRSLSKAKLSAERKIDSIKKLLLEQQNAFVTDAFKDDLTQEKANLKEVEAYQDELKELKVKHKDVIVTYEKFLELCKDLPNRVSQSHDMSEKDFILGKIFLNFTVKDKNVLSCQLNPPSDAFVKSTEMSLGREEATLFEPLIEAILTHWKPLKIDLHSIVLTEMNRGQGMSGKGFTYQY